MNTSEPSSGKAGRRRLSDRVEAWVERYPNTVELISKVVVPVFAALIAVAVALVAR